MSRHSEKGDIKMSVDKNKVVSYFLKGLNKIEDGVYTENILSGDLSKLSYSMVKTALENGKKIGAKQVDICLYYTWDYAKLRKKDYPDAEGVVAVRVKGINHSHIEKIGEAFQRIETLTAITRNSGNPVDYVLLANEEGIKAVEVNESNEQIAENSKDTTTKYILEQSYNDIPRDEGYIAFCNGASEDAGMER